MYPVRGQHVHTRQIARALRTFAIHSQTCELWDTSRCRQLAYRTLNYLDVKPIGHQRLGCELSFVTDFRMIFSQVFESWQVFRALGIRPNSSAPKMPSLTASFVFCLALLTTWLGLVAATPASAKRQIIYPAAGIINAPVAGTAIAPGATFPFSYSVRNVCESGYSAFTVWLLPAPPTNADLDASGNFVAGSYLYDFGEYVVANFGAPSEISVPSCEWTDIESWCRASPMQPTPPPSFTMPDFSTSEFDSVIYINTTMYLAVVESYLYCPGGIYQEFGYTSNAIVYNATSST
ncbi:hypothetical protein A0H81_00291 [Grifola frondosa]|uniref:Uncharacterized protein n=1 Tax=Grifola frondosa TaxID=5627 RepID=A0A1C7MSM3_GRIFR|nr:hypothetical protein A0H81_00291 [Grifola frondosa]